MAEKKKFEETRKRDKEDEDKIIFDSKGIDERMEKHFSEINIIGEHPPGTIMRVGENLDSQNMGKVANAGMTGDDSKTSTRLLEKNWSPLIVRKYYVANWPLYVGIICDCNLNDLDQVVLNTVDEARDLGFLNGNIQDVRNFCGFLSDQLDNYYNSIKKGSVEGLGIAWYVDKMFCSSLSKDMMVHKSCRDEFYSILRILPHI